MKLLNWCVLAVFAAPLSFAVTANTPNQYSDWGLSRYSSLHENAWEFWGLTQEEWARYEFLKTNSPWSAWEHNATPLQILSFYASSRSEKKRYARLEAELDQWRQHSSAEFQSMYNREREIVHSQYTAYMSGKIVSLENVSLHDKLKLFISANSCDAACRALMKTINDTQATLDIFLLDAEGVPDDVIFEWAKKANVSVDRVKVKQVTLNRNNGLFAIVAKEGGSPLPKLPALYKEGGDGKLVRIPL